MDIISYILSKKYVNDSLAGAGALAGKSAYEIAQENGFSGSATEWLASLQGDTPEIGPNGTWVIGDNDTGVIASPSLVGYATQDYVNEQIANINFPESDLSSYATRKELNEAILGIKIPDVSEFATKEELEIAIKSIPVPDLTPYALKTEIPSIAGLASEEFVLQKIAEAELGESEVDLSAYYTKSEVDEKIESIEHPVVDLTGYATEQYVNDTIAAIPQPDLNNYVTDEELLDAIGGIQIPSIEGLASEEYVQEQITQIEIPDITGLATENYVDEAIAGIEHPNVDLTNYATKTYVQELIDNIEMPEGTSDMVALTKEEILEICK